MARLPYVIPYDPDFLGDGFRVRPPHPRCAGALYSSGDVIDYIHYSLVLHRDRRTALFTAHNIDVAKLQSVPRTSWDLDSRMERAAQTGPSAYANNPWDRGHLVRRAAVAWGTHNRAKDASDATFYYTNAAPQHQRFNQDEWLALEDWVLERAGGASTRLCVFTGPLYTHRDQFYESVRIPSAFWKIVVLRDPTANGDDLAALGFVMKQNTLWHDWNGAEILDLHLYQVGINEIGGYTGLEFGELATIDEFEWRQARFRDRTRMRPVRIEQSTDIEFFGARRRARGIRVPRVGPPPEVEDASAEISTRCCDQRSGPDTSPVDDRVESLKQQVDALRDVVDALLAEGTGEDVTERTELRREARNVYERIVGGQMTGSQEFPHCACIGGDIDEVGGPEWFCSGVLVHERVVLTAAHCAPAIGRVYLGARSINLIGVHGEVVPVERAIVHPEYDPDRVPSHDVAVLILANAAETAAVTIASTESINTEDNVTLVGFGYEHATENVGFGTKRKVDVPLTNLSGFSADEVAAVEETHGFVNQFELHAGRKMLGKDSCNGDSGGPVYVQDAGVHKLAAVTSRAAFSSLQRCGDGGIYTRIAPYLGWMHDVTGGMIGVGGEEEGGGSTTAQPVVLVYISSAQPNPAGPDKGNEWVEVTNGGDVAVALSDYAIADKQGGRHPLQGIVSPRGKLRVVLPEDSPVKLANAGDEIALLDSDTEVHRVTYSRAGSGEILTFDPPQHGENEPDGGEEPEFVDADPC